MEYVSSFTYCDSIQTQMTDKGPINQIVSPLQVLAPIAIPGNFSFAISGCIMGLDVEKENIIRISFVSPSGHVAFDTQEITIQLPRDVKAQDIPNFMQFNLDLRNIVINEKGLYITKIEVNKEIIGEYKIQVIKGVI